MPPARPRGVSPVWAKLLTAMTSVLDRKLLVITGKGGVGKSTIAAAAGLLAAQRGRRVIVVELGNQSRLPRIFGLTDPGAGLETQLAERL